jgi:hypothetical protein
MEGMAGVINMTYFFIISNQNTITIESGTPKLRKMIFTFLWLRKYLEE